MRSKYMKIVKNFVLNFMSYALPTFFLQFVVQPIIARRLGSEANGQYLALMSLNYYIIAVTASVLNTVRMLQNEKYKQNKLVGDFNIFYLAYVLIVMILFPLG